MRRLAVPVDGSVCSVCGLDQVPDEHSYPALCIAALRAALAEARDKGRVLVPVRRQRGRAMTTGRTTIRDTDGGEIEVMPSSGVMAGNHGGPFVWVTITPGKFSAKGTVHLTADMVNALHGALDAALDMMRGDGNDAALAPQEREGEARNG